MEQVAETNLAVILQENELSVEESSDILQKFSEIETIAAEWKQKASELQVTSEDQVAEMKLAREGRLFLQKKRTAVENTRKEMKAEYLKKGRAIDDVAKYLKGLIEPIEEDLENKEKFAERAAAERQARKQAERMSMLEPYNVAVEPGMIGSMTDAMFDSYLKGVKADHEAAIQAEKKAEEERIERERISNLHNERKESLLPYWNFVPEAFKALNMGMATEMEFRSVFEDAKKALTAHEVEQEKIRQENERLRKEAEAKEAQLAKERAAAEEKARKEREAQEEVLRKERQERERVEAELQAKRDAEESQRLADEAKAKEAEAERLRAEKAPDKEKINAMLDGFNFPVVNVTGKQAQALVTELRTKFEGYKQWASMQVDKL